MWRAGWEGAEQMVVGKAEGRAECGESRLERWEGWSRLASPGLGKFCIGENFWVSGCGCSLGGRRQGWRQEDQMDSCLRPARERRGSQTSKGGGGDERKSAALKAA